MLKVGLTGSIGSGKSTIAKAFSVLGVPVYFTDDEAKKILDQPDVTRKIVERFGPEILGNNGIINRNSLAALVFNDNNALQWLNSLIHPEVRKHFFRWVKEHSAHPYIIQESAIMLETGFSNYFDVVVVVSCPLDQRINRVLSRDKMTRQQVLERMENQWPEELKLMKADVVIVNDDNTLALPQVVKLHNEFLSMSFEKKTVES